MKPQRILITGGAGFIGSHTTQYCLERGAQVLVLDNLSTGKLANLPLNHPHLEFIEGDILEYPLLQDLVSSCDAVLHLAAIASVPESIENPIYSLQVNTQGFLHVLEAIRAANRPMRLVYASSAAVYGDATELPCKDDQPLTGEPLSPYALQKIHCEDYARLYQQLHHIQSLGLRYFNVYGLRQDPFSTYSGVISRFINRYQQEAPLLIFGDGQQSRDFIHVSDIARANWLALQVSVTGALNIATGKPESLLDLVDYLKQISNKKVTTQFQPARAGDILTSYASIQLAKQLLNFESTIPLAEGLQTLL